MFDACNISPGPGLVKHGKTAKEIGRKPGTKRQNGEKNQRTARNVIKIILNYSSQRQSER
jgi:hypothetical protein